jgi:uncharacterized membrane protein YgaE (UPF0421/DUF939 family)
MLHMRRNLRALGTAVARSVLFALRDRLAWSDPGLMRFLLAARGTLSVVLTTVAALLIARAAHLSFIAFANGITLSLMIPFLAREPSVRERLRTLLLLSLPSAAAVVATALLHSSGPAGDASFLILVFVCFLLHPLGPRMIAMGLAAVVMAYVGLFLELPPATLPLQLAGIGLAVPVTAFACFVVLPMRPERTLRRIVESVQLRAAHVLQSARAVSTEAAPTDRALAPLRRDLARLNEAALAADDQLAMVGATGRDAVRAGLIDLELVTARLIDALRTEKPGPRHGIRLLLHERRMRRGGRYVMPPGQLEQGSLLAALVELGHAVHALGLAARQIGPASEVPRVAPPPAGALAWRVAARVTLAAALAMAGGMALSPQRWFWAVITVYLVFLGARSRGDTIYRGLQRVGGTILGIASGLVLATFAAGHPGLETALLLLSVFGMFYYITVSYTVGIFCVTVLLGLLYGMMGAPVETLLVLRLEETAIGAAAGILVATFVYPVRTRDQVMRSGRAVLASLVGAVRECRQAVAGASAAAPMVAMRRVDRQVADLRLALAPLTVGRSLLRRSALERPVPALLECVHWTRVLAAASHARSPEADDPALAARVAAVEIRLAALAGMTVEPTGDTPPAQAASAGEAGAVAAALDRLQSAVTTLAERLEIGALEGFALDF